jgi:hypothetical protein
MGATHFEPQLPDDLRSEAIYNGDIVLLTPRSSSHALCEFAWGLIEEKRAQFELPVATFVEMISALKPWFADHPRAKQLLCEMFDEVGCDPSSTYFDVPKLRVGTSHPRYFQAAVPNNSDRFDAYRWNAEGRKTLPCTWATIHGCILMCTRH